MPHLQELKKKLTFLLSAESVNFPFHKEHVAVCELNYHGEIIPTKLDAMKDMST